MHKFILILFSLTLGISNNNYMDDSYEALWKEVSLSENKNLPKSAYEIVEKIYSKAKTEKRDDQLIKAILYGYKLNSAFEDYDPAQYITDIESERANVSSAAGQAIMASLLGELYQAYAMNNVHGFGNRTDSQSDNKSTSSLSKMSLPELQKQSIGWYKLSLEYRGKDDIKGYAAILENLNQNSNSLTIQAQSLDQFLLYRALQHFSNSASVVSLPTQSYKMIDPELFSSSSDFIDLEINTNDINNFKYITLDLYKRALSDSQIDENSKRLIDIKRIEYVYSFTNVNDKENLYLNYLNQLVGEEIKGTATEYAYIKLIKYYLRSGYNYANNYIAEYERSNGIAYGYIQSYKKRYPDGDYKSIVSLLQKELNQAVLSITAEGVYVPDTDFLIMADYRNVSNAYLQLIKLTPSDKEKFSTIRRDEDRIVYLRKLKVISQKQITLPGTDDYNQHSTEIGMDGLGYGSYALLISNDRDLEYGDNKIVSMALFDVSDLSYTYTDDNNLSYGYVLDRMTGLPIADATVDIYKHSYNNRKRIEERHLVKSVSTDKQGRFEYEGQVRNFSFVIKKGADVLDLNYRHYHYKSYRERAKDIVNLYTDRAIYRPGQVVYYKGLSFTTEAGTQVPSINTGDNGAVIIRDVNNQTIAEQSYTSNEYGTFSGSIVLPDDVLTGNFSLSIQNKGYLNIKVEEYKRPKIYAEFKDLDKAYKLGDTIILLGTLKSFSGASNANANVSYQVNKSASYDYYKYSYRRFPVREFNNELISSGEIVTDDNGNFEIIFPTNGEQTLPNYRYSYNVQCDITDITGETTQVCKAIRLLDSSFEVKADIPDRLFIDDLSDVNIDVLNIEGQSIDADIIVDVYSLDFPNRVSRKSYWRDVDRPTIDSSEILKRFPLDMSLPKDYDQLNIKEKVSTDKLKSGEAWNGLPSLKPGMYKVVLQAKDDSDNTNELTRYIALSDKNDKAIPVHNFWISKLKEKYNPGDRLDLIVNTPYDKYHVLYKISHGRRTIEEGRLDQKNNTLRYKVSEKDRGNISIELLMVHDNRIYKEQRTIKVPWDNKSLDVTMESFRNKIMPGAKESYSITVKDKNGKIQDAEILASIYDASLDQFSITDWVYNLYPNYYSYYLYTVVGFGVGSTYTYRNYHGGGNTNAIIQFSPYLNKFGLNLNRNNRMYDAVTISESAMGAPRMQKRSSRSAELQEEDELSANADVSNATDQNSEAAAILSIATRENLEETVFFYPNVVTTDGIAKIDFTMNEALTTWKLRLIAHTKDLKVGYVEKSIVTQKNLMIEPHLPRYLRQGDHITLNAKVTNLSDKTMDVNSSLMITDAISNEELNDVFTVSNKNSSTTLDPGQSKTVDFSVIVPEDFTSAIIIKMIADGGNYQDGEQSILPVLSNRKLVTESTVFHIPSESDNEFTVTPIEKIGSTTTLDPYNYTIEVSSNPAWIVAKSIPYLIDADMTSTDNIFNAMYGTLLGKHLVSSNPKIADVIKVWNQTDVNKSSLNTNADLKISGVELTPWLRDAQKEEYNMKRLSFLVDDNNVTQSITDLQKKLKKRQLSNGGFVWTSGGLDNWYITQQILEGIGHLNKLGIQTDLIDQTIITNALNYIDDRFIEYHNKHKSDNKKYVSQTVIHYLYVKSYFDNLNSNAEVLKVMDYYWNLLDEAWTSQNTYMQAMICIAARKSGKEALAQKIYQSLTERMIVDDEIGNYWNDMAGYYWYNPSIEKHALLIELYEDSKASQDIIDGLKLWLLKNKQTNSWNTSKATSAAIYAFMINADSWLNESEPVEVMLPVYNEKVNFKNVDYATGYGRVDFAADKISSDLSKVKISNPNKHIAWGAAYFQYWEELNNITSYEDTPLKLTKNVYNVEMDNNDETLIEISAQDKISIGDKLRIKIELSVDRPMEYIQMRDMRSSGIEPFNVLSQYKWQDGLGYYESTKDVATFFYFDYLPKGDFIFEYDVYASHQGAYSNGITEVQSMYSPEFSSHSEGVSLLIVE